MNNQTQQGQQAQQQQPTFAAPTGQMKMPTQGFTAPSTDGKVRRQDIQLVPFGLNLARIVYVIDLGTHVDNYMGQTKENRKLLFGFEIANLKQLFYEDDTELKSTMLYAESSFFQAEKSKLTAICKAISGIGDYNQLKNYDLMQLLGANIVLNVSHQPRKTDGKPKEKIESFSPATNFNIPQGYVPEVELQVFFIDKDFTNFNTLEFAKLPGWIKNKIIASKEAQLHISRGGTFAKLENNQQQQSIAQQNQQQNNTPQFQQPANLQMTPNAQSSYQEYRAVGWTDEALVQNGLAVYVQQQVPQPPQVQQPPVAQPPQGVPNQQGIPPQANQQVAQPQQGSPLVNDDDLPF